MSVLLSVFSAEEYFDKLHRILPTLDEVNIRLIQTMKQEGPRNLQNVARNSKTSYSTVYSRITRLDRDGLLKTGIHPNYSGIGLTQANVMITPFLGKELSAREALRIPGYWLKIVACIGETNGYFAVVAVPSTNTRSYEDYFEQLVKRGIIRDFRISWLGESVSPITNFDYYDIQKKTWRFEWDRWLKLFKQPGKTRTVKEARRSDSSFDKRDLVILKELMKDARIPLVSLAKILSITLPATKYRFDRLIERGLVHDYIINILPYAPEVSELLEIRLDFRNLPTRINAEDVLKQLPFVLTYSPFRNMESITMRVYIPRTETRNLLTTLSRLVHDQLLASYSYIQLDPTTLMWSTFGYKDFDDKTGWFYDNRKYLQQVDALTGDWEKRLPELGPMQAQPVSMFQ